MICACHIDTAIKEHMTQPQPDPALAAAENYEKHIVTYMTGPCAALLVELADPRPGERVLDVACGTGIVARRVAPRVGCCGTVVGVDINPAMLAVARSLPAPDGAIIDWRKSSALALPLDDNAFDLVLCQHGLQFFPDRVAALREMYRVLRPGGRAAICVWRSIEHHPRGQLIWEALAHRFATSVSILLPFFNLGDASELEALLEAARFTDVTITARAYTVREPRSPQIIAPILESVGGCVPAVSIMGPDERAAVARAVEGDIGRALQTYVEGDEQVYQTAAHIALGRK